MKYGLEIEGKIIAYLPPELKKQCSNSVNGFA
jgi:hypothetical protein